METVGRDGLQTSFAWLTTKLIHLWPSPVADTWQARDEAIPGSNLVHRCSLWLSVWAWDKLVRQRVSPLPGLRT